MIVIRVDRGQAESVVPDATSDVVCRGDPGRSCGQENPCSDCSSGGLLDGPEIPPGLTCRQDANMSFGSWGDWTVECRRKAIRVASVGGVIASTQDC
ncbi:hypothetical protein SDC9_69463 [bioreactor metagenome]|uniref:Uncharacterized protein n=1 Tax=bioreactor metagenome TaxID=1076179 RepID=A0A644Y4Y1_9ZZZZ